MEPTTETLAAANLAGKGAAAPGAAADEAGAAAPAPPAVAPPAAVVPPVAVVSRAPAPSEPAPVAVHAPVAAAPAAVVLQAAAGEKVGLVSELGELASAAAGHFQGLRAKLTNARAHLAHGLNGDARHTAHAVRELIDMLDDSLNQASPPA